MAYCGSGDNKAIKRLLHIAVSLLCIDIVLLLLLAKRIGYTTYTSIGYSTVARDLSLKTIPRPRAQRAVVFNVLDILYTSIGYAMKLINYY